MVAALGEEDLSYLVPVTGRGERIDQHLAHAFPQLSRSRLKSLLDAGAVTVNGASSKPGTRLRGGEAVRVLVPAARPAEMAAQDLPLDVLHEDRDVLVVNKAAGMVVHPAAGNWDGTLVNALLHHVKDLQGVGGELRPGIVHRLDKDTSGCLVVAKHEKALVSLQQSFVDRRVGKTYLALVQGSPSAAAMRFETFYGRHPVHRQRFTGKVKAGKHALTEAKVLERFEGAALLEVALHTGRTHQIRVHLSEAGLPILADPVYGSKKKPAARLAEAALAIGRQALHAWKLSFPHPRTGKVKAFTAPVPEDFERALAALRNG